MNESSNIEYVSQFLLAEFNSLQDRARSYEEIKSSRVNFFLLVVAAAGAIFSAFSSIDIMKPFFYEILLIITLTVLLIGLLTLKTLVDYSAAIVIFYRRAGRIRKWFVNLDQNLEKYVAFEATDERPKFKIDSSLIHWRGGELILLLINCLSMSLIIGVTTYNIFNIQIIFKIIFWILTSCLFWFLQLTYIHKKLSNAENSDWAIKHINFRQNSSIDKSEIIKI